MDIVDIMLVKIVCKFLGLGENKYRGVGGKAGE
jgi:hypothetical protein